MSKPTQLREVTEPENGCPIHGPAGQSRPDPLGARGGPEECNEHECLYRKEQRRVRDAFESIVRLAEDLDEAAADAGVECRAETTCGTYHAQLLTIAAIAEKTRDSLKDW